MKPVYRNYGHYIQDGWSRTPKKYFIDIADLLEKAVVPQDCEVLDIGCATGNFLGYIHERFPKATLVGVDVFDELLETGRQLAPYAQFKKASVFDVASVVGRRFDVVTALGVLPLFSADQLESFFDNVFRCLKPNGRAIIMSPFNEFGVDVMTTHRKHINGRPGSWETAWNVYALETITDIVKGSCESFQFSPFQLDRKLEQGLDPGRTWTHPTEQNPHQLMNGLKLLIDLYFLECVAGAVTVTSSNRSSV